MKQEFKVIKKIYETDPIYDEVRTHECMKKPHIISVHGSYAYGTNTENSDIDIRCVSGLDREYALCAKADWESHHFQSDTVTFSYRKFISMLSKGNPDAVAIVGQDPEDYIYLSKEGRELVGRCEELLGARSLYSNFMGYANAQLRRIELAELGRLANKKELVKEKKESILTNAMFNMHNKYLTVDQDNLSAEFLVPEDDSQKVIVTDFLAKDISIDDFFDVAKDVKHIVSSFGKPSKRNNKKSVFKLNKHCMHLIRGMLMGIEILETGKVRTYRDKELPLLRSILNGEYIDGNRTSPEFYALLGALKKKADYAYRNTVLPQEPNINRVCDMMELFWKADMDRKDW